MDAALTGQVWADRLLGGNESVKLEMNMVFLATGNNVQLKGDLARRTLRCRIAPQTEFPEKRDGFKRPRLLQWVKDERPRFVMGALTLLRAFIIAEAPQAQLRALGGYEGWSDLIRSALVWLGMPDPVASQQELREEAEPEREAWADVLKGIYSNWADSEKSTRDIVEAASAQQHFDAESSSEARRALGAALENTLGADLTAKALGRLCDKWKGRIVGGYQMVRGARGSMGRRWKVVPVKNSVDGV